MVAGGGEGLNWVEHFSVTAADSTILPGGSMHKTKLWGTLMIVCATAASAQMAAPPPAKSPGDALNLGLNIVQQEFVSAAAAMPEEKYAFAPTSGEFTGVRTFGQQVKHVAAANYAFGSRVLGEKPPVDVGGENGPEALKSKAEIMKFLTDSFAYLQKALATVSDKNELDQIDSPFGFKVARLSLASFSLAHPMDHYGQIVEYLRLNGIVPPASRPRGK
jgi:uncharacterized damage-inducible protein DinB